MRVYPVLWDDLTDERQRALNALRGVVTWQVRALAVAVWVVVLLVTPMFVSFISPEARREWCASVRAARAKEMQP